MGAMKKKIYIVHGWAYNLDKWQPIIKLLKDDGIEAVMLKVPGLTKPSDKVWDLDKYVDWLHGELQKVAKPVVLVGHSNGGRISMGLASKYPNMIDKLVLIDSAGIYHNEPRLRLKRAVFGGAAKLGKRLSRSKRMRRVLYKLARAQDYHDAPPNMRETMANLGRDDAKLDPSTIKTPTTIIWGKYDTLTPLTDAKLLHDKIAGSKLTVIQEARHAPFYTHPHKVLEIIKHSTL